MRKLDRVLASWVESIPESARGFFVFLAFATHPASWSIVLAIAILTSWIAGNSYWVSILIVVLALLPLEFFLKNIFRRTRPETMYVDNMKFRSYSFPSGHSYSAALVAGAFSVMAYNLIAEPLNYLIAVLFVVLAATIGVSRIYLGAHFPSDVIGGWATGAAVLFVIFNIVSM